MQKGKSNWHLKERFPGLSLKGAWKILKTENYRVPPRAYSSVVSGVRIGRRELAGRWSLYLGVV